MVTIRVGEVNLNKGIWGGVLLAVVLLGCEKEVKVGVSCAGADAAGVVCTVTSIQGNGNGASACWDVVIDCANGSRSQAHGCQDVDFEGKASRVIPLDKFSDPQSCNKATGMSVTNIRISERH